MSIPESGKRKPGNRSILAPIALLVVSLILLVINTVVLEQQDTDYQNVLRSASDLENLSQKISGSTIRAVDGVSYEFDSIDDYKKQIDQKMAGLTNGGSFPDFVSQPQMLQQLSTDWNNTRAHTETIIGNKETITSYRAAAKRIKALTQQMQEKSIIVADQIIGASGNARQVMVAYQQIWLTERILNNISEIIHNSSSNVDAIENDAIQFQTNLKALQSGNAALGVRAIVNRRVINEMQQISDTYQSLTQAINPLVQLSPVMSKVLDARISTVEGSEKLLSLSTSLVEHIDEQQEDSFVSSLTGYLFALLSLLSIVWIGFAIYRETNHQLAHTEDENLHNQNAILTLLDDLGNLADGDLTTSVTVTEDFTGAIADSINYTIDQLRILVSAINETSVRVSGSAEDAQETANQLAKASLQQAKEISGATNAVHEMVNSIEQVSRNASESTSTAEQFLILANTGADVVDNTLSGMETIREQIQDTSKRIKRLSESSQEIGDIVSLIDDIADQTNILALNAAIQASMAGDAGRGFAVVADEVQRLAERSSAATKQIEALVKTIQSDTNEAGISMEQTTTEVVNGARLAQDAASALGDIEKVSNSLATLIDNISGEAQQQLSSVENIAQTMTIIQEITTQTLDGSQATSKSIGNLTSISGELRETVAGFQLPRSNPGNAAGSQRHA
ncbi:MAG: methyl-accepting chemotaxis protein [Pseudomonadales bacterium]|nr:methyl-accepting chemotaxis protein [Pseudomonadales bacterium]